ncbi:MAG: choice-of-anchor L domain-containing protein, partial [Vicingaceae bacterium]|nr:choice-of-anchor L domain-containing protein [Vicingaceae bacterium]
MKKVILLLTVSILSFTVKAQINVSNTAPYNTPAFLVNNVLLGNGVSASNITFSGNPAQIGYFSGGLNGAPNIGLDSGIVMSTGDVNDIPPGGNLPSTGTYAGPGDPDLLAIAQSVNSNPQATNITQTQDAAFLEFDFTPTGDSVKFNFVFASAEYPGNGTFGYINEVFNDVFALFVSGPGFSGPYAAPVGFPNGATNVAVVPGTTTPITISTIYVDPNQTPTSLNGQYYIDNSTQQNNDFNGFTTSIEILFPVNCGAVYHFKIAIADAQDDFLDTGLFLEASSFSSSAPVAINFSTATTGGDTTLYEGCDPAVLNLTRSDTAGDLTVHFAITGTATNGVDYSLIADSVTYLSGIDTASIIINPLTDVIAEGAESIIITTTSINACGNTIVSTDSLFINDTPIISSVSNDLLLSCPDDSVLISANVSGAIPPYSYLWTDSQGNLFPDTADIFVPALVTDTFYVNVTGHCNLITTSDTVIVNVTPMYTLTTSPNDTNICVGDILNCITTPSITGNYTYSWSSNTGVFNLPNDSLTQATFNISGSDTVVVSVDNSGCIRRDTFYVNVADIPNINITTLDTLLNCTPSVPINVDLGAAPVPNNYSFSWTFGNTLNNATIQNPNATPNQGITNYLVTVTDTLGGCFDTDSVEVRSCCIVPTVSFEDATCFGLNDGKIVVSATALNSDFTIEFRNNNQAQSLIQTSSGNPSDSLTNLGPGSYIVVIFDTIGCSFTDIITITEPLPVTLTNVTPDTTICIDGTATLYGTPNGTTLPLNLVWDNGLVGNGPHNVNPASATTYSVYAEDGNGCVSTTQTVSVTLYAAINIIDMALSQTTICEGASTDITVNASGGGPYANLIYTWLDGNNNIIGATGTNTFTVTPSYDEEVFSVVVSDSCTTPTATDTIRTDWSNPIYPTYTATDTVGCYDQIEPTFTNTTVTSSVITNVQWDFDDGQVLDFPFSYQIPHSYDQPGIYNVKLTVTDIGGCTWDTIMPQYQIDAHRYPEAEFDWTPNPTDYLNAFVTFKNQSVENDYNQWIFITDAQYTNDSIDPTFQFPQDRPGNYDVTLTVTNEYGCRDSITKVVIIDDVFLFYIPTGFTPDGDGLNDEFKVVSEGVEVNNFRMSIFNKWGELIFQTTNPDIGWDGTHKGSPVPDGVYIWKI